MVRVGDRVSVSTRLATVRYVGEVEGHPGEWAGLEWDNPTGGKHDGTVKGRRYFSTRFPTNGSLMKISAIPDGVDLLTAIDDRYNDESAEVKCDTMDPSKTLNREVKLIGMKDIYKKQSNIHNLTRIVLESSCVNRPPPRDSCAPFPVCLELNLYRNLLHKWDDVREILLLFPKLVELALRGNRMDSMDTVPLEPLTTSPLLVNLLLSDCDLTGDTICNVLSSMAAISVLYALRNRITRFSPSPSVAARLTMLDLEQNGIGTFDNLVGNYPMLHSLNLSNCQITSVTIADPSRFPSLRVLYLRKNAIRDWPSIGELNKLPVAELYIDVDGFEVEKEISVVEVMIAKLTSLTMLNRLILSEVERRSAEVRFVAKYSNLAADRRLEHQADIDRLVQLHGVAAVDTTKSGLRTLKMSICHQGKTVQKALPLTSTVQKLNEMLCRLFRVDPLSSRLHLANSQGYSVQLSDDPLRPFSFFSPDADDVLHLTAAN